LIGYSRIATPAGSPAGKVRTTSLLPVIQLALPPVRSGASWLSTAASVPGTGVAGGATGQAPAGPAAAGSGQAPSS
jgi:hypothetical protein